jgi:hypothetical protein
MITTTLSHEDFDFLLSVLDEDQDQRIIALRDDLLRQKENQRIHIVALERELINRPLSN